MIFQMFHHRRADRSRIRSQAWLTRPPTRTILRPRPAVSPSRWYTPRFTTISGKDASAMRKRLRKKPHLGAFMDWGVPLAVRCQHPDGFDDFLDEFIAQAIEAYGLTFGGGGHDDRLTGVIEGAP
jgi:ribosomal protein L32E